MLALLAVALVIAVLACVFALQNASPVTVTFLTYKYEASHALILLSSFAIGAVTALLASLPTMIGGKLEIVELRSRLKKLEQASAAAPTAPPQDPPPADSA
ncbi:MAG: LapA family protein [Elusimicrobiota bacterium]